MVNLTLNFQTLRAPCHFLVYIPLTGVNAPDMTGQERYENERERFVNLLSAAALVRISCCWPRQRVWELAR